MKQIHFVFDIDDTMCRHVDVKTWREDISDLIDFFGEEFAVKHVIWAANFPHYIFPGIPELWRWLHSLGHRFSLCSSGIALRNDEFADNFLKLAFDNAEREKSIRDKMRVMSRLLLVDTTHERDALEEVFQIPYLHGNYKKQLGDIFCTLENLPYTLLIDDDPSYVAKGELKNYISVRTGYEMYIRKYRRYDIYCYIFKAFLMAGLFQEIFDAVEKDPELTVIDAAWKIQIQDFLPPKTYASPDERPEFKSQYEKRFYLAGEKILQQFNPQLRLPEDFCTVKG